MPIFYFLFLLNLRCLKLTLRRISSAHPQEHHLRSVEATRRHKLYHAENKISVFKYTRVLKPGSPEVARYCRENKCRVPGSAKEDKKNEYRDLWVQRNYVTVEDPMPTVRRRYVIKAAFLFSDINDIFPMVFCLVLI